MEFAGAPTLTGVDFAIGAGEFVVVLGPSGCGKTTLLRIAAGLLAPTAGAVCNGFARTAMVFQEPRLTPWGDAVHNAAFGLKALGAAKAERLERARELLLRFGFSQGDLSSALRRCPAGCGSASRWRAPWPSRRNCC